MPMGKVEKYIETTPLSKILSDKDIAYLKEKAIDPDYEPPEESESDTDETEIDETPDPMDIAPDMAFICKELLNKGGIRFDNCQEFSLFWDLLEKSDYSPEIKKQSQMILMQVLNFANMWIIHYSKHSG
jgi:hypothetical protein